MDYSSLPLSHGQIRLITILRPELGQDTWTSQIKCHMEAVNLRDTPAKEGKGGLPENYIHFDQWVTNKPEEAYGAAFFRDIGALEETLKTKEGKRSKALRKIAKLATSKQGKQPLERHEMEVDVNTFGQLVTRDDIITNIEHEELLDSFKLTSITEGKSYIARFSLHDLPPFYSKYGQSSEPPDTVDGFTNFVAMSYAWGDPNGPKTKIQINGQTHEVGESLYTGLRQFRTMEFFQNGGKIWIDALCINQTDNDEKQEQLKLMGNVYRFSGNIVVWLGEEADNSAQAIKTLQSVSTMYRTEYIEVFDNCDPILAAVNREQAHFRLKAMLYRYHKLMSENYHIMNTETEDRIIYHFFNRPYWRRLWIIQEVTNGRAGMPIICGNQITQWRYIRDAALVYAAHFDLVQGHTRKALGTVAQTLEHSVYHVAGIAQLEIHGHRKVLPYVPEIYLPVRSTPGLTHGPLRGTALKQALMVASQSNAFMAKDRVYGMLQIPGLPDLKIDVDYKKSLGIIYREFATVCINASDNLEILFLIDGVGLSLRDANDNPQEWEYLPSWVPDFGAKRSRRSGPIEGTWYAGMPPEMVEKLPKGTSKKTDKVINGDCLTCWGFFADVITGLGAISPVDREVFRPGNLFEAGVFQSTDFEDILTGYKPEWAATKEVVDSVRTAMHVNDLNPPYGGLDDDEIWRVLTAGTLMGGEKAPLDFRSLLHLPSYTPGPTHEDYRNHTFITASSTLILPTGETFSSHFHPRIIVDISAASRATSARQAMEYRTRNRRLILSSRGHLGLAPMVVQPGDCILIVVGHDTPIVARPAGMAVDSATGKQVMSWSMIGEAWISGMMDGQMFKLEYDVPKEMEAFHFI